MRKRLEEVHSLAVTQATQSPSLSRPIFRQFFSAVENGTSPSDRRIEISQFGVVQ